MRPTRLLIFLLAFLVRGLAGADNIYIPPYTPTPNPYSGWINSNVFFSPYNWDSTPVSEIISPNPGAYFKANFTGTSFAVSLDNNALTSTMPVTAWPWLDVYVDEAAPVSLQIQSSMVTLVSGLATGSHTIFTAIKSDDQYYDRWTGPGTAIRVVGFQVDNGSVIYYPKTYQKNAIFYGDSITEGVYGEAASVTDPQRFISGGTDKNWAKQFAKKLQCEYGIIGYGSQGWIVTGSGNVPGMLSAWSMYNANDSRLIGGKYLPCPDYIVCNQGTNDTGDGIAPATITAAVTTMISNWRGASSQTTEIYIVNPFNHLSTTAIYNGLAEVSDAGTHFIEIGPLDGPAYTSSPTYSIDGTHPNISGSLVLGSLVYGFFAHGNFQGGGGGIWTDNWVGINTQGTPNSPLEIGGYSGSVTGSEMFIDRTSSANTYANGPNISMMDYGSGVHFLTQVSSSGQQTYMATGGNGTLVQNIDTSGNVGIGTMSPGSKHNVVVNGQMGELVSGNSNTFVGSDIEIDRTSTAQNIGEGCVFQEKDTSDNYNHIRQMSTADGEDDFYYTPTLGSWTLFERQDWSGHRYNFSLPTAISGTSGSVSWTAPEIGTATKILNVGFSSYVNTSPVTISFPVAYQFIPILNDTSGLSALIFTVSTTQLIIPIVASAASGTVQVSGF